MTQTPDTSPSPPPVRPVGPHNFTGLPEWGVSPVTDRECVDCGVPYSRHPNVNIHTGRLEMYVALIAAELAPLRDHLYLIAERLDMVVPTVAEQAGPDDPALDAEENQAVALARSLRELGVWAGALADRIGEQ